MKLAFWSLFAAGLVACSSLGIGKTLERVGGSWTAPSMLAGIVLGVAILVLAVAFGTGTRPAFLSEDSSMVVALAVLIGGKVAVALVQAAVTATARG